MTKFQSPKNWKKKIQNISLKSGAHLQYIQKHSVKFQRSGLKTVGGVDFTKQVPSIENVDKK